MEKPQHVASLGGWCHLNTWWIKELIVLSKTNFCCAPHTYFLVSHVWRLNRWIQIIVTHRQTLDGLWHCQSSYYRVNWKLKLGKSKLNLFVGLLEAVKGVMTAQFYSSQSWKKLTMFRRISQRFLKMPKGQGAPGKSPGKQETDVEYKAMASLAEAMECSKLTIRRSEYWRDSLPAIRWRAAPWREVRYWFWSGEMTGVSFHCCQQVSPSLRLEWWDYLRPCLKGHTRNDPVSGVEPLELCGPQG